jgi:hypothetical protein
MCSTDPALTLPWPALERESETPFFSARGGLAPKGRLCTAVRFFNQDEVNVSVEMKMCEWLWVEERGAIEGGRAVDKEKSCCRKLGSFLQPFFVDRAS